MTTAHRPARGQRRSERTRSAIMTAGQQLFAARAIDGVTIDDIVTAAAVAKGSFYNHFDDKESLASAIVALVQGDCEFHIFAANRDIDNAAIRMTRALCVMINYGRAHPERLQAMLSLAGRGTVAGSPLNAGVTADIREGLASGRFAGVTIEAGVLIAIGMIGITVTHAITEASATKADVLAATMGAALLRALGVAEQDAAMWAHEAAQDLLGRSTAQ